jgi:5-methylcytosine-specific restriction enzyme subunit McrC
MRATTTMPDVHVSLREWSHADPAGTPELAGFRFASAADRSLAARLTRAGTIELLEMYDGLHVKTASYVGRIRIGSLTVTVRPKLGTTELLSLFRYAFGLKHAQVFDAARYVSEGALFADLVIAQLYAEVRDLVDRGIHRTYVRTLDELASPRGRVEFPQLARRSGLARATLPCSHHPRSTDRLLNRVMLSGIELGASMAGDRSLRAALMRLRAAVETAATPSALSAQLLDRATRSVTRLTAVYGSILQLIEILYFGSLLDLDDPGESARLPGFLFDMNRFWQRLLERFLTENLPDFVVESERGLVEMMRYVPGHNPRRRRAPTPRPDFALRRAGKLIALLDAKYRDLWSRSLPEDMLYQLSVYALSQPRRSTAAILYPTTDAAARPSLIEIRDLISTTPAAYVALRPVHLGRLAELVGTESAAARDERCTIVRALALGEDSRRSVV